MHFQRAAQACIEGIPARINDSWKPDDSEKVTYAAGRPARRTCAPAFQCVHILLFVRRKVIKTRLHKAIVAGTMAIAGMSRSGRTGWTREPGCRRPMATSSIP